VRRAAKLKTLSILDRESAFECQSPWSA
jgi:hypothetical protein